MFEVLVFLLPWIKMDIMIIRIYRCANLPIAHFAHHQRRCS